MKRIIMLVLAIVGLATINSCKKKEEPTPKPTADFAYTGGGCTAPCAVLFENKSKDATTFSWSFGDGTTSTEANPTKTYNVGGTYSVTLTATGNGGSSSTSKQVLIQQSTQSQLPTANFTFSGGGCTAPCSVTFTNTSTNATSYLWDFGDGATSTDANPSHTYTTGGTISVTLKAINAAGDNQITKTVNVTSLLPTANFSFSGGGCMAPCTVSFTNMSSNATSYLWDFGDGATSTDANPSHTYTAGGSFTVTLKATSSTGNHQISKNVNISAPATKVKITKVTIENMPFADGSGAGWDNLNGPDVFFKITDQASNVLRDVTSSRIVDVTSSMLPLSWTFTTPLEITDFNAGRYIEVWDYDTPDPDDYIGYVGFLMSNYTSGSNPYPATVTGTRNGITVKLNLTWQ